MSSPSFLSQESNPSSELDYIQRRNKEELLHENWTRRRGDLEKTIQERLEKNLKVRSSNNRVKFVYKYKGHKVLGSTIFRFKIILIYHRLLRKWYISPGYSFVPEAIDLYKYKLKSGTHNPFSEKVLNIIHNVKRSIDVYMTRLTVVYKFVHDMHKRYKDIQFAMDVGDLGTKMEIIFSENAWPNDVQKSHATDIIVIKLELNEIFEVQTIVYKYRCRKTQTEIAKDIKKLESKLQNFHDFPLREALERFIIGEERFTSLQETENSE